MNYSAIVEKFVRLDDAANRLEKLGAYFYHGKLVRELGAVDQNLSGHFPCLESAEYHLTLAEQVCEQARHQYGNRM